MAGSIDRALAVQPGTGASPMRADPGSIAAWQIALRPRTFVIAISPVLAAIALIWARGETIVPWQALLVLLGAILMQVITNLQNDVGYTVRGGERSGTRVGLPRATATGLLTVAQVRTAIVVAIAVALLVGLPLVMLRGLPLMLIGLVSIVAALSYMGGPRPIAYTPFGEAMVMLFFGLVAMVGADFALTGSAADPVLWLAGLSLGGIATAVIAVNNSRDVEHDAEVGRHTLAVAIGRRGMDVVYGAMVLGPMLLLLPMAWIERSVWLLLPLLLAPSALLLVRDFAGCAPGLAYNGVMFRTILLELKFTALLVAGAALTRLL